jgi:hypothetical protein
MVVPVMMISNVILSGLGLHALEIALSVVPEMVIGMCDIGRSLGIKSAVALYLVGVGAGVAVEHITVMYPDMVVLLLQSYVIAFGAVAVHEA